MPDRKFGVELELAAPQTYCFLVANCLQSITGSLRHPVRNVGGYARSRGTSWDIKTDSSCGVEVASPALTLEEFPDLERVCHALQTGGFITNRRCGVHVHHGARHMSQANLRKLVCWWGLLEPAFLQLVPEHRRGNPFCLPYQWRSWHDLAYMSQHRNLCGNHHASMTLFPLRRLGTVEFRLLEGTLDPARILDWTLLTRGVLDTARRGVRYSTLERLTRAPIRDRFHAFQHYATEAYSRDKAHPIHKVFMNSMKTLELS